MVPLRILHSRHVSGVECGQSIPAPHSREPHMPGVGLEADKHTVQGFAMEISVSKQELLRELTATQSVVERKTTIPILSNFLLEADEAEGRLTITATDLDQSIKTS